MNWVALLRLGGDANSNKAKTTFGTLVIGPIKVNEAVPIKVNEAVATDTLASAYHI